MTEKQEKKLPNLLRAFLLINPQSESANQNVLKVLDVMPKEAKAELFEVIRTDLRARLNQQIEALESQIEMME